MENTDKLTSFGIKSLNMLNQVNTVALSKAIENAEIQHNGKNTYTVKIGNDTQILELINYDLDLKTMTVRSNHTKFDLVFKNNLDLVLDKMGIKRKTDTLSTEIKAPMPGKVIEVLVSEGDAVTKGEGILILEAMKMENVLKAEHDCEIKAIHAVKGESVEKNEVLVDLA